MRRVLREVYEAYTGDIFLTQSECEEHEKHCGVLRLYVITYGYKDGGFKHRLSIIASPGITRMTVEYLLTKAGLSKYIQSNGIKENWVITEVRFEDVIKYLDTECMILLEDGFATEVVDWVRALGKGKEIPAMIYNETADIGNLLQELV